KKTSSSWIEVHLVRSLPVRYPPKPEAMISVTISHIIAPAPKADALPFIPDQGEIVESSKPDPSASRIRYTAAETNAPPITAPHETPDDRPSRCICTASAVVMKSADKTLVPMESPLIGYKAHRRPFMVQPSVRSVVVC